MNNFTIECMAIIESYVNKESFGIDESLQYIIDNFSKNNMVSAIKTINAEYKRNKLNNTEEYIKGYKRLKEILKNISMIFENIISQVIFNNEFNSKNILHICNIETNKDIDIHLMKENNKYYLTFGKLQLGESFKTTNSIKNKKLILKDKYNNYYKFIWDGDIFKLDSCYALNNYSRLLIENINYISPFGVRNMAIV